MSVCSKCGKADDLDCPACDLAFCISCFVDHGKTCYQESRKAEQEQKKCSICGRYASINPVVHCSDCQIEICRSCLYAHRKKHEAEKNKSANWKYCVQCGLGKLASGFYECSLCHGPVCVDCSHIHAQVHKTKHLCVACGTATTTECDECRKPYCESCFALHKAMVHEKKCAHCKVREVFSLLCPTCQKHVCTACFYNREGCPKARQEEPPHCIECDMALYDNYTYCQTCHHFTCSFCIEKHQKTHEKKCAVCGVDGFNDLVFCKECNGNKGHWFCSPCYASLTHIHSPAHKEKEKQKQPKGHCAECGTGWFYAAFPACSECGKSICGTCAWKHKEKHEAEKTKAHSCAQCKQNFGPFYNLWTFCSECKQQICLKCQPSHRTAHEMTSSYSAHREYGFDPNFERYYRLYQNGIWSEAQFKEYLNEQTQQQKQARTEKCSECKQDYSPLYTSWTHCSDCGQLVCPFCTSDHRRKYHAANQSGSMNKENIDEWLKKMFGAFGTAGNETHYYYRHTADDDESEVFKSHYRGYNGQQQQQRQQSTGQKQQPRPQAPQSVADAFKLLNLGQSATTQEIRRAFKRMAKQGEYRHPDVGGDETKFKILNAAQEIALQHAKRNGR